MKARFQAPHPCDCPRPFQFAYQYFPFPGIDPPHPSQVPVQVT